MTAIRGRRRRGSPCAPQKDFWLRGRGSDVGAEGRGLCTAAGTGRGGGAPPALRVAACSTAVSTGLRASPGSPGGGRGAEGALPRLGLPPWRLCSAPRRDRGTEGTVPPERPGHCPLLLLGFGHVCRGSRRGPVSREPRCQRSDPGTEPRRAPHLRRAAPRCRHRARAAEQPRHRSQRLPPAPLPTAPLPAPRPACSALLRCTGLRWENACPLGKRNVCEMFAIN